MAERQQEHWSNEPEEHDYPAALAYLALLMDEKVARRLVASLRKQQNVTRKAKDLLRASGLPLLSPDNVHVAGDLKKVEEGKRLSPVLLVRGSLETGLPLVVADGYHRICASYHLNEDTDIPCRIADLPAAGRRR